MQSITALGPAGARCMLPAYFDTVTQKSRKILRYNDEAIEGHMMPVCFLSHFLQSLQSFE